MGTESVGIPEKACALRLIFKSCKTANQAYVVNNCTVTECTRLVTLSARRRLSDAIVSIQIEERPEGTADHIGQGAVVKDAVDIEATAAAVLAVDHLQLARSCRKAVADLDAVDASWTRLVA